MLDADTDSSSSANAGEIENSLKAVTRAFELRAALIARGREDWQAFLTRQTQLPSGSDPLDDAIAEELHSRCSASLHTAVDLENALANLVAEVEDAEQELAS